MLLSKAERKLFWTAILTVLAATSHAADNERCQNTPQCICKWSGGKRMADCSNAGFSSIPHTLSPDTQTLIMDGNPLGGLDKDVFKSAGMLNLQKISLRGCDIKFIEENAFRDLKILVELDLTKNNLTKLRPRTFDGNDGLQSIRFAKNPISVLQAHQFPPLRNLKFIDFSECELEAIDSKTFQNLGASVETVVLHTNRLKHLEVETFVALQSLRSLQLHSNPWICDCKLKNFRDWLLHKKLYLRPTACNEPARLHDKMWDEISAGDFACKPDIVVPQKFVFGSPGVNVTLACLVSGSPSPQVRWVVNGRIVNNNTSPAPFSDQKWIIREESASKDNIRRWYNLTVTNAGYDNLGDYLCVAENNGGVMERTVTLTFDDPSTLTNRGSGGGGLSGDQWTVVVGATTAAIVFIGLMVFICCCCYCKRKKSLREKKNEKVHDKSKENGSSISGYGNEMTLMSNLSIRPGIDYPDESEALLSQHHQQHHLQQQQIQQQRAYLMSTPRTNESSTSSGVTPEPHYIPDLLEASTLTRAMSSPLNQNTLPIRKTSTPLSVANLMQNSPGSASCFHRSGTLPLPHHYQHGHHTLGHAHHHHHTPSGRSISCDHSAQAKQGFHPGRPLPHIQQLPVVHYHPHPLGHTGPIATSNKHPRPGYVTLPRRPRSSWSAPPPPQGLISRESPSPSIHSQLGGRNEFREPIYDGVGPRTSADGSSKASLNTTTTLPRNPHLNKSFDNSSYAVRTPLGSGNGYTLPPYYAPIEEVQECPPTPKERPRSTPNILDFNDDDKSFNKSAEAPSSAGKGAAPAQRSNNNDSSVATSSSEITLMEENISAYCEPFGTAVLPPAQDENEGQSQTPNPRSSVATYSSTSSELELLMPTTLQTTSRSQQQSSNVKPKPAARTKPPLTSSTSNQAELKAEQEDLSSNQINNNLSSDQSSLDNSMDTTTGRTSFNGNNADDDDGDKTESQASAKKIPPKTLPKPKVRPIPPPKPKKSAVWVPPPLIGNNNVSSSGGFQDETVDGSEV